jgi:hypothetical protein
VKIALSPSCTVLHTSNVGTIRFSDAFHTLDVLFTAPTDRGNTYRSAQNAAGLITADTDCSVYFNGESVKLFGNGPTCSWQANDMVSVYVGYDFGVSVGTVLQIRPGVILAIDPVTLSTKCSVPGNVTSAATLPPSTSRQPTAVLDTRDTVQFCDDVTLRSGASLLSSPRVARTYTVSRGDSATVVGPAVTAYLMTVPPTAVDVTIPSAMIPPGTYVFQLTLVDYFTGVTVSTKETMTKRAASDPGPSLTLLGTRSISVFATQKVTVAVTGNFNPCVPAPATGGLRYAWGIEPAVSLADTTSSTLEIAPMRLQAGVTYQLYPKVIDTAGNSENSTIVITVKRSALIARLSDVTVGTQGTASIVCDCVDPDGSQEQEVVAWDCIGCDSKTQTVLSQQSLKIIDIVFPTAQQFTLFVIYRKGTRAPVGANSTVTVRSGNALAVRILGPTSVLQSSRTTLLAQPTGFGFTYKWGCAGLCSLDLTDPRTSLLGDNSDTLVINGGVFSVGLSYLMTLNMSSPDGVQQGFASFRMVPRMPPSGGGLKVNNPVAEALSPNVLTADGWIGEADALPLQYQ